MRINDLKHNEQTGDIAIVLSGGRATIRAKALDVRHNEQGVITYALLDRLIPEQDKIDEGFYRVSGAFVSEIAFQ